jgi:phosphoglycerate dehydrogenase-like enzyme
MRIVVLDDIGIGAEDLRRLQAAGDLRVFSAPPSGDAEIVERLRGADVVISGWTKIGRDVLHAAPGLRLVSLWATGLDNIDLAAAHAGNVTVCNVPSYATDSVAELALGLMLAVIRKIPAADRHLRRTLQSDWRPFQGSQLRGKTLGVVGTGVIGQRVARLGHCLGMPLLGHDLRPSEALVRDTDMSYVSLPDLFAKSEIVTLHAPLTPDTEHLVDASLLRLLPETAVIINTSRAGLVRQDDLYAALAESTIAGAGLDVIDLERESGRRLLELENVVATPHIGFYTQEALGRLTAICVENVIRFIDGDPINVAGLEPDSPVSTAEPAETTEDTNSEVDNDGA